ncbi:MAG: HNH endonuclease [Chitinophagaceae bacterium]|nr:HNH endonuclease [Chitinophagaceae bacterium]
MKEQTEWVPIKNYENYYEINSVGEVRSLHKPTYGYKMEQRLDRAGYYTVRLNKPGRKSSTQYVHRLLGFAFIENPDNKCCINHIDGNKLNNSINNLEWVTPSENMLHAYNTGLLKIKAKSVLDTCTGKIYSSIKEAAKALNINYGTCRNYLNGNIKTNNTCLRFAA